MLNAVKKMQIRNIAFNIAQRALGYISKVGVTMGLPNTRTLASIDGNAMMTREATDFNHGAAHYYCYSILLVTIKHRMNIKEVA